MEWNNLPETRAFLAGLKERFGTNAWFTASGWDQICRIKGRHEVINYIESVINETGSSGDD